MSDKRAPSDFQIIKAFQKFEEAFNVWREWIRANPAESDTLARSYEVSAMWDAHRVYRKAAIAAQERINAKKAGKEADHD